MKPSNSLIPIQKKPNKDNDKNKCSFEVNLKCNNEKQNRQAFYNVFYISGGRIRVDIVSLEMML